MSGKSKKVRKAVIAAAGFGTRFLPQTKAMPKEMLPLVDKPIIQHIVEELVEAGIEDVIIITGYHKRAIEDHFDQLSTDLLQNLTSSGKDALLKDTERISNLANFAYVRQKGMYGNGTPILNAEHLIGDEPFIYAFADDFIESSPSRVRQLITTYKKHGGTVLSCVTVKNNADYDRYGFVAGNKIDENNILVRQIVEKPGIDEAPSALASVSGYLFTPEIFSYLRRHLSDVTAGQEFNLQPAIQSMIHDGHQVIGREISNGKFYDTGNKLEYIKTVIDFGLRHPDIKDELFKHIRSIH
jgi:UTP--glucose-1-phosphate uridylyltransferase